MEKTDKLLMVLDKMIDVLSDSDRPCLGFSDFAGERWIYIGDDGTSDAPWYFFINNEKLFINQSCLSGFLMGVEVVTREFKGKSNLKLLVRIKADQSYVIQVGLNTVFAKGLLLGLERFVQLFDKSKVLSIVARKGDAENVNFCSVFVDEQLLKVVYPAAEDWYPDTVVSAINVRLQGENLDKKKILLNRIKAVQNQLRWSKEKVQNYAFDYFKKYSSSELTLDELNAMAIHLEMFAKLVEKEKKLHDEKG